MYEYSWHENLRSEYSCGRLAAPAPEWTAKLKTKILYTEIGAGKPKQLCLS